ncbi:MAG: S8 family serine peptidase [Gammaproteobacteria bacterium]|nr:S8 family serine peptidase [Gammaproteobacteria bacterium]MBU1415361.1 S8 family serine peptidase [Gammaproteobacteria bacterium]
MLFGQLVKPAAGIAVAAVLLLGCQQPNSAMPPESAPLPIRDISAVEVQKLFELRNAQNFVPGEVVVKMKTGTRASAMAATEMSRMQITAAPELTSGGERIYRVAPTAAATMAPQTLSERTLELVRTMAARADVEYAQPNFIFQLAAQPSDPGFAQQWHYFDNGPNGPATVPGGINLPQVWETNKGSNTVVVAVIDTGILSNHPDITGSPNLATGFDMISDPLIANDGDGRDNDPTDPGDAIAADECYPGSPAQPNSWHGTHVAGTIGVGNTNNGIGVAGINWNVKLQAVRVLGKCGGTMTDINDAIRWAAGINVPGVPANPTPARVINMSLGANQPCSVSPATQSAINDAVARGTAVVVAAGNDASDASGSLPAGCNGVITVAASDARGYLVTRYSNYGTRVDLLAPGGDTQRDDNGDGQNDGVLSMVQGGYARYNGTSMAAPHVAGVAALALATQPTLTPATLLARLKSTALPRNATQCPRPCGAGLLDARAALADGGTPPPAATISLQPASANVPIGQTGALTATVIVNGAPAPGRTVQFSSSNPLVATVAPASAATGASGTVSAEVTGIAQGNATITASSENVLASSAVTVPARSSALPWPLVLLVALAASFLAVALRLKRRHDIGRE